MYKAFSLALLVGLMACEPPGPSEAEIAAKALEKSCARLYEGQTKVFRDMLYKQKIPEDKVNFAPKADYVKKCIEAAFSKDQMKCIDPNLRDKSCEETMKGVEEKEQGLKKFLFSPMSGEPATDKAKPDENAPPADGAQPAGDAAAPATDATEGKSDKE